MNRRGFIGACFGAALASTANANGIGYFGECDETIECGICGKPLSVVVQPNYWNNSGAMYIEPPYCNNPRGMRFAYNFPTICGACHSKYEKQIQDTIEQQIERFRANHFEERDAHTKKREAERRELLESEIKRLEQKLNQLKATQ